MDKLKTLAAYLVSGITLLGFIIIYGVMEANRFNLYIFGFGILLLIPAVAYLIISKLGDKGGEDQNLKNLKLKGHKVLVDLTKSQIISNSWTSERESNKNSTIVINELTGNSYDNRLSDDLSFSQIKHTCDFNGVRLMFISSPIAKDRITLEILLEMQRETTIYIDRDNPNYYYFDIEFIST